MKHNILFLGSEQSPVLDFLKKNAESVTQTMDLITSDYIKENKYTFLISYGYRYIIKREVLDLFPDSAINLHISFLPFNRGADPNFWSFVDKTPKGVTIHYIDEGVDTGDIIVQKEVNFIIDDKSTLASTYEKLHQEIAQLFIDFWPNIKTKTCSRKPQKGEFTLHKAKDKAVFEQILSSDGWNTKIFDIIKHL